MSKTSDKRVCVAAIAGAFGVRGEVKIKPFTEVPEDCLAMGPLTDEAGTVILTPKKYRPVKKFLAVTAPEVTSREAAEALKSTKLYVLRSAFPEPEEDEFYYSDLIGLEVVTIDGEPAGRIKSVQDFGAGDLLEIIKPGEKSRYHPFTKAAVPHVDMKAGIVTIEIVEPDEARREDEEG